MQSTVTGWDPAGPAGQDGQSVLPGHLSAAPLIATVASRVFNQLLELNPHNAEQILSHFKAELTEDVAFQEQTAGAGLG